jgi:hypothetical protein
MSLYVQILQDAPAEIDHAPLFNFMQWAKEHDFDCYYGNHYNLESSEATIVDFGILRDEIESYYVDLHDTKLNPPPPDIREWLQKEIDAGRVLAWIGW